MRENGKSKFLENIPVGPTDRTTHSIDIFHQTEPVCSKVFNNENHGCFMSCCTNKIKVIDAKEKNKTFCTGNNDAVLSAGKCMMC